MYAILGVIGAVFCLAILVVYWSEYRGDKKDDLFEYQSLFATQLHRPIEGIDYLLSAPQWPPTEYEPPLALEPYPPHTADIVLFPGKRSSSS
jgi:hypothetical protein